MLCGIRIGTGNYKDSYRDRGSTIVEDPGETWLLCLGSGQLDRAVCAAELLIKSGSEVASCPKVSAAEFGLKAAQSKNELTSGSGQVLAHLGESDGELQEALVKLIVADMARPVLPMGEVMKKGSEFVLKGGNG